MQGCAFRRMYGMMAGKRIDVAARLRGEERRESASPIAIASPIAHRPSPIIRRRSPNKHAAKHRVQYRSVREGVRRKASASACRKYAEGIIHTRSTYIHTGSSFCHPPIRSAPLSSLLLSSRCLRRASSRTSEAPQGEKERKRELGKLGELGGRKPRSGSQSTSRSTRRRGPLRLAGRLQATSGGARHTYGNTGNLPVLCCAQATHV